MKTPIILGILAAALLALAGLQLSTALHARDHASFHREQLSALGMRLELDQLGDRPRLEVERLLHTERIQATIATRPELDRWVIDVRLHAEEIEKATARAAQSLWMTAVFVALACGALVPLALRRRRTRRQGAASPQQERGGAHGVLASIENR